MFSLKRPSPKTIEKYLARQKNQTFSYREIGFSQETDSPRGYNRDHYRIQLGSGSLCFEEARKAICQWKMFDVGWVQLWMPDTPIQIGETVVAVIHHLGFWSLNASRIVYIVNEETPPLKKFGFAYGTLLGHGERGEERFVVEWNQQDNSVWYEIFAFSRPAPLGFILYPYTRYLQKRFANDSKNKMKKCVNHEYFTSFPGSIS